LLYQKMIVKIVLVNHFGAAVAQLGIVDPEVEVDVELETGDSFA